MCLFVVYCLQGDQIVEAKSPDNPLVLCFTSHELLDNLKRALDITISDSSENDEKKNEEKQVAPAGAASAAGGVSAGAGAAAVPAAAVNERLLPHFDPRMLLCSLDCCVLSSPPPKLSRFWL